MRRRDKTGGKDGISQRRQTLDAEIRRRSLIVANLPPPMRPRELRCSPASATRTGAASGYERDTRRDQTVADKCSQCSILSSNMLPSVRGRVRGVWPYEGIILHDVASDISRPSLSILFKIYPNGPTLAAGRAILDGRLFHVARSSGGSGLRPEVS